MSYAKGTSVSVDRSRLELERVLTNAGASQRGIMSDDVAGEVVVCFTLKGFAVRWRIPIPKAKDIRPACSRAALPKKLEQATRERWRQVILLTKAKLEAIALGFRTVDQEWLADLPLPDGRSVHEAVSELFRIGTPLQLGPARSPRVHDATEEA